MRPELAKLGIPGDNDIVRGQVTTVTRHTVPPVKLDANLGPLMASERIVDA